jgi:amino acid adenylation domain-containing protein
MPWKEGTMAKPIEDLYELSPAQRGMFFHSLYAARGEQHLQQLSCVFEGPLDPERFRAAWQAVMNRHPILRTSFHADIPEKPLQVVHRQVPVPLVEEDLSALDPEEQAVRIEEILAADRRRGFDLARPPLLRLGLYPLGEGRCFFLWSRHHLLLDGWSLSLVLREVFALYEAGAQGGVDPPRPRPFRDYLLWSQGQDAAAGDDFWRREMAGVVPSVPLVPLASRAAAAGPRELDYGEVEYRLPRALTGRVQALARSHRLTINTLVQGAWGVLLSRLKGTAEVVFGTTVSGRPTELEGSEAMVGMFINTIPVRLQLRSEAASLPWLEGLQQHQAEMRQFEHRALPEIHRWSDLPSGAPLFDHVLAFENFPTFTSAEGLLPPGLAVRDYRFLGARTDYPWTLLVVPGERLLLRGVFDQGRIPEAQARQWLECLEKILGRWVETPQIPLGELIPDVAPTVAELSTAVVETAPKTPETPVENPPRTPVERRLAEIWGMLLGLESVDIHTPFFDLGGHSLLAVEIVQRARQTFGIDLPLRLLAEAPTVATLAAAIARRKAESGADATPVESLPTLVPDPDRLHRPFPLTDVQHAYWVGRSGAFQLGNVSTHSYQEREIQGLELPRLEGVLQHLIRRHGMLRAVVLADGNQKILAQVPPYRIAVLDLRQHSAESREKALGEVRQQMSHQVLPADVWPLFEVRASLLDGGRVRLHISSDALIRDAWSTRLLARELMLLYRDPEAPLPPLELSFRDYVLGEEGLRESAPYRRSEAYWRGRLDTLPPAPELPLARDPSTLDKPRFQRRQHRLEAPRWQALQRRAAAAGVSASGLLLAVFAEALRGWSKEPRFTLNLTLFNRRPLHPQVAAVVGDFTSLTLLEVAPAPGESFETRARRLQEQLWDDLDHSWFGGVRLLRELARRRGPRGAAMPVVFTSTLGLARERSDEGLEGVLGEEVYSVSQTPQVLLDHQAFERDGALTLNWDAVEAVFPEGLLDALFAAFQGLLERLAMDEGAWGQTHSALLPADHATLYAATFERRHRSVGRLHEPFFQRARQQPDHPAVMDAQGTLTYGEVALRAGRLAQELAARGVRRGDRVAVVMDKGWEQVVATLGILAAGGVYVPVDPELPDERRHYLTASTGAALALTQPSLGEALEWPEGLPLVVLTADAFGHREAHPPALPGDGEDLAYIIFTSGSTGLPKGVTIRHRSALTTLEEVVRRFAVGPEDRVLALSSLSFDLSVFDFFGVLAAGATVVVPDGRAGREPDRLRELLEQRRVTVWNSVPALMEVLVDSAGTGVVLPSSLRLVLLSGDWIPLTLPERIRRQVPEARVISLGGATEGAVWSIAYPIEEVDSQWPSVPYGKPLTNQTFHVLDRALEPRPVWVPGDLYIGGDGIAVGYWGNPRRTALAFVPHPVPERPGQRLYRTGDLGRYLPDGNLEFLGREDFQVKIQGYRIELGEIESVLLQHPAVRTATVLALGERMGSKRLAAFLVTAEGESLETEAIRVFLADRLPTHMIPTTFTELSELPLTANGKVDRKALTATGEATRTAASRPPEGPLERMVAGIWEEMLGLSTGQVGAEENFYALGGDSLIAIRLVARLRQETGAELPLRRFFALPTVAAVARVVEEMREQAQRESQIAATVASIDQLSPEEVEAMLAELEAQGATPS